MAFHIVAQHLNGLVELRSDTYADERGFFREAFRADHFNGLHAGLPSQIVQVNHSYSVNNVVRGLHTQANMGKLISVISGQALFAEVDVRPESDTYGQHRCFTLDHERGHLLWVPPGFANGFAVVGQHAHVVYACTSVYNPDLERGIHPLDAALAIPWGVTQPTLSDRDANAPGWKEYIR